MAKPAVDQLAAAAGQLATASIGLMEEGLPWYRDLGAQERAWVGQVAQAGIGAFIDWYRRPASQQQITVDVFGAAPPELARVLSLEQTVALVRTTIAVVESAVNELDIESEEARAALREGVLRYSREIAFAAAEVYARAAEAQGAWSARVEAIVVDALLRDEMDESITGRLGSLGWQSSAPAVVVAGSAPSASDPSAGDVLGLLRRAMHAQRLNVLTGIQGEVLLAVVGGSDDARIARLLVPHFGGGPVVHSAVLPSLASVGAGARTVLAGLAAARGWRDAPRPVRVDELLPERVLSGDADAVRELVERIYQPLAADAALLETTAVYLERAGSLEATARALFIHPNTVRHRLRRITDATGYSPADPRDAYVLRTALTTGRLTQ